MANLPAGSPADPVEDCLEGWYLALEKLVGAAGAYARSDANRDSGILFPTLEAAAFLFAREEEKLLKPQHRSPRSDLAWCPHCVRLMDAAVALGAVFDDYVTLSSEAFRQLNYQLLQELAGAAARLPTARAECDAKSTGQGSARDSLRAWWSEENK